MMEGWEEYKLDDIGSFKNGANFSSDKMGSGIPLVNVKDITDSPLLHPERMDLVEIDISSKSGSAYLAKEGDIFFVRSSVKRSGVGAVGMLKNNDSKVVHCGFVIRFRLTSELILPRFAFYLFNTSFNREKVRNVSGGATIVNISQGSLKMLKFKFPPLKTQRKIASILSAYDDLIENNLKRIKLLEEQAQLTYEEWFVRFKFPGHETTKFDEDTGLPEGWEKGKLKDLGEVVTGKTPSTSKKENYDGDIPFIKTPDMSGFPYVMETSQYLTQKGAETQKKKYLPKNSLLVSCIGSAGQYALVAKSSQFNQQINAIKFSKGYFTFYTYCFSKYLKPLLEALGSNGATMTNVNKGKFENIDVLKPSEKILELFHNRVKSNFDVIYALMKQNQHLKEARDILLPRLMSGMINVEKLDVGSLKYEVNDSLGMVAEDSKKHDKA